jgi:hypothetical protein
MTTMPHESDQQEPQLQTPKTSGPTGPFALVEGNTWNLSAETKIRALSLSWALAENAPRVARGAFGHSVDEVLRTAEKFGKYMRGGR